ncbi:hypothetical protein WA577_003948, partial [Blastocystis sp. JDR]
MKRIPNHAKELRFLVHVVGDLHQPYHTDASQQYGSLQTVTVGSITENVHFFTDHVAGAIANPRDLPFSSQSLDLIRQLGKSIGSRCTAKERSGDISTLLLRWAEASHEKKKAIDAVLQNRS